MNQFLRIQLGSAARGQNLAQYLARAGYPIHADCGGKGKCGKCRVKLFSGVLFEDPECTHAAKPDQDGRYYACRVYCGHDSCVLLPQIEGEGLTDFAGQSNAKGAECNHAALGIALDIGTTTLAAALVNRQDGSMINSASALNPQSAFGADVISRIEHVMRHPDSLSTMQAVLLDKIRELLQRLAPDKAIGHMVVAGNPTMLHIFCGISPVSMGSYPFTPVFTESRTLAGKDLCLPVDTVTLLPSISAFVGGDITSGMLHCSLTQSEHPTLLVDVGTNGECVLFTGTAHQNRLYAASAAAGPAMEGAGISTGMGGVSGAVCAFRLQGTVPVCSTVDDTPAQGICGSGLIDLVSALYGTGVIDETGAFEHGEQYTYATTGEGLPLTLTQADIRALQLSKSAIRACIEALCARAGLTTQDIECIYLAGGFGYYMNTDSAIAIGLLPANFKDRTVCIGNASLGGCVRVLCDASLLDGMRADADRCQTLELSTDTIWNEAFMEHMTFPFEDEI